MKNNEVIVINGTVENEVLAFNTDAQVDEETLSLIKLGHAVEGLEDTI